MTCSYYVVHLTVDATPFSTLATPYPTLPLATVLRALTTLYKPHPDPHPTSPFL